MVAAEAYSRGTLYHFLCLKLVSGLHLESRYNKGLKLAWWWICRHSKGLFQIAWVTGLATLASKVTSDGFLLIVTMLTLLVVAFDS